MESSAQPPLPSPAAVDVVVLDPGDLVSAGELVGHVWGMREAYGGVDFQTLRAYLLAGEPLLGAYLTGRAHEPEALVGTSIAFVGTTGDWPTASPRCGGRSTRSSPATRSSTSPSSARGTAYFVDVYGSMPDATNEGDESDRVEAVWDLTAPVGRPVPDLDELIAAGAEVILSLDGEVWRRTPLVPTLLACTPTDVAALRRDDPAAALGWRTPRATRSAAPSTSATSQPERPTTVGGSSRPVPNEGRGR